EGDLDAHDVGNHAVEIVQHLKFVFPHQIAVVGIKPCDEASQRCYTVTLANAEDTGVNVSSARLQSRKAVGDCATAVVVSVELDARFDVMPEFRYKGKELPWSGHSDGVRQTHAVHTH